MTLAKLIYKTKIVVYRSKNLFYYILGMTIWRDTEYIKEKAI